MPKILVIDDAEFILESTTTLLKFEGYEVFTAPNGREGIKAAYEHKPNLILCDISMPELDGYGVLEEIRKDEALVTIPFIFLTAFTEKRNMRMGMELGANDYLIKPFTREELLNAINSQLKKTQEIDKQLQQKVDEVGQNISVALPHEFRTVLNQVIGSAGYLNANSGSISSSEIKELSNDIISSSKRLLKITENYLIYSRIEYFLASKSKQDELLKLITDEPAAVIDDIVYPIAQKYNRGEDIATNIKASDIFIRMSTDSYFKVIEELVDNAFKFSRLGNIVKVNAELNNNKLEITINDSGSGMSEEHIRKIAAYLQFDRNANEQQGVGLGLIIAKRLVELHEGTFNIYSKLGTGTTAIISLPAYKMKN